MITVVDGAVDMSPTFVIHTDDRAAMLSTTKVELTSKAPSKPTHASEAKST